jgi:restriction system protein
VDSLDLSNQRRVDYLRVKGSVVFVPRYELSEGLQRRLRVRGTTVSDLYEFGEEIETLFDKENFGWLSRFEKAQKDLISAFKTKLLQNLREGNTNLEAGGVGLEYLVRELLEIEGYQAQVLSKRAFSEFADADIRASRADRFGEINLLVQVKHHTGITDTWGAKQLAEIHRQQPTKYPDYKLVLVSTAEASDELREMCEKQDIILFTGSDLASWIFEAIPKLDPKTRIKLGMSNVPKLAV